jgi:hypothetical protein
LASVDGFNDVETIRKKDRPYKTTNYTVVINNKSKHRASLIDAVLIANNAAADA